MLELELLLDRLLSLLDLLGGFSGPPLELLGSKSGPLLLLDLSLLAESERSVLLPLGVLELGSFGGVALELTDKLELGVGGSSDPADESLLFDESLLSLGQTTSPSLEDSGPSPHRL